jgi:large subunit ribosomal protein L23
VDKKASKEEIRTAVEKLYKVKVATVRTLNVAGKPRRTRSGYKTTPEWKKALVTLEADNKIDLF